MKISNRLKTIASLVPKDAKIMDVGCDHALLDIFLVSEGRISSAVASDVRMGPIVTASRNVKDFGYEDKIELLVSDGIEKIKPDIDTVIISGMGGLNIIDILSKNLNLLKNVQTLILSPHSDIKKLRDFLEKTGYMIACEKVVFDNKYYVVMKLNRGKMKLSEEEKLLGPYLISHMDRDTENYFRYVLQKRREILSQLPSSLTFKKKELKKEIEMIETILDE